MGGADIERYRKLEEASPRSGKEAGVRQLAELARQFAILGASAIQRKRVLIRHALVNGGEWLNKRKILDS
jgi:hypothetical protein